MQIAKAGKRVECLLLSGESFLGNIAKIIMVVMASVITVSVVGRYIFNSPLRFTDELSSSLMIPLTFLGIAYVQRKRGHVYVELLFDRLSLNGRRVVLLIIYILVLATFTLFSYTTIQELISTIQHSPTRYVTITLPHYYLGLKFAMLIGLLALCTRYVAEFYQFISGWVKGEKCPSH